MWKPMSNRHNNRDEFSLNDKLTSVISLLEDLVDKTVTKEECCNS